MADVDKHSDYTKINSVDGEMNYPFGGFQTQLESQFMTITLQRLCTVAIGKSLPPSCKISRKCANADTTGTLYLHM